jgi:hypothetical protein
VDIYTNTGEDQFIESAGYMATMLKAIAIKEFFLQTGLKPKDIHKLILSPGNPHQASLLPKEAGFSAEQLLGAMMLNVGESVNCKAEFKLFRRTRASFEDIIGSYKTMRSDGFYFQEAGFHIFPCSTRNQTTANYEA